MIQKILLVVASALAVLLIYAASKPKEFSIQRSTLIGAKPEKVFPLINNLKAFNSWNPFAKQDPDLAMQYEGAPQGKGAAYTWSGPKSGQGRMEITAIVPEKLVMMSLDFSKPMQAHNKVVFSLTPQAAGTLVTWTMSGHLAYLQRLLTVFVSMDKMVGSEFDKGLASLKELAEKRGH
jgi:uncharacterized protein YndB with AHSA1/START domain